MAQLKYLDLPGLRTFWNSAKAYIDNADALAVKKTDIVNDLTTGGTSVPLSAEQGKELKTQLDAAIAGGITIPVADTDTVGGVLSGGDITVAAGGTVTVNKAATADGLTTARTIALTGGATGSATFNGTADASIAVTVDPAQHQHTIAQVTDLQTTLDAKAPLASPALTGTPTAPTADAGTNTTQIATTAFVKAAIDASVGDSDHIAIKGTVNSSTPLPETDYKLGDAYIVGEAGTYAGEVCEAGDWIIAIKDYVDASADSDWSKIQKNITAAVAFTGTPTAGQVVKFNAATGIVENASFTEAQVSEAITKAGTAVQTVAMTTPSGDANPSASVDAGVATIKLPAYTLASTYTAAMAGIDGTIMESITGAVDDVKITSGTIAHGETESVSISGNEITITIGNYAAASAVTALSGRVDTLESEVDANTAKLDDITGTVGATIDSKITAGLTDGGVIDNRIDALISAAVAGSGVVATAIDTKITSAIDPTSGSATAGEASYIPTVAVTKEEITSMFGDVSTLARVGSARVGTARVAASN